MPTMHIVSCRKNFWSPTEFSETDEIRAVNLDTGASQVVAPAVFLAAVAGKRLTVLVHGYNNERTGCARLLSHHRRAACGCWVFWGGAQAEYEALVGFAWPGGADRRVFPFARQRADETAPRFGSFLATLKAAVRRSISIRTASVPMWRLRRCERRAGAGAQRLELRVGGRQRVD